MYTTVSFHNIVYFIIEKSKNSISHNKAIIVNKQHNSLRLITSLCRDKKQAVTNSIQLSKMAHHDRVDLIQNWDDCFGFRVKPIGDLCLKYLQLRPDDLLADVGAGTGNTTEPLWKAGILKHPILCVDPSAAMLEGCKLRVGLNPLQATAFDFFSDRLQFRQNKVLAVQCIHLWPNLQETFNLMYTNSPPNFKCVIVTNYSKTQRAYWKAARERFEVTVKPGEPKRVEMTLKNAGFKVEMINEIVRYTLTKAAWHFNLQNRSTACLNIFSEEEIEKGLCEIDKEFFPGASSTDQVEIRDNVAILIATKMDLDVA